MNAIPQPALPASKPRPGRGRLVLAGSAIGLVLASAILMAAPFLRDACYAVAEWGGPPMALSDFSDTALVKDATIEKQIADLQRKYSRLVPQDAYLVVSTSDNTFELRKGVIVIRKGVCSTGSYVLLTSKDSGQRWMFKTPRGMFRILEKEEDPVWHRPDWAFVEEGKPVPSPGSPERDEYGVLGAYAMSLGQGYMIHGTLYQRFLGMPVTHGCVRLGDEDLEAIFKALKIDSKVFIY